MPRWSAERRDVPIARDVKTPRKRLTRASQARKVPRRHLRFSALRSPSLAQGQKEEGKEETKPTARAGAAKQAAGGAVARCQMSESRDQKSTACVSDL
jgi:hypothetical protein